MLGDLKAGKQRAGKTSHKPVRPYEKLLSRNFKGKEWRNVQKKCQNGEMFFITLRFN